MRITTSAPINGANLSPNRQSSADQDSVDHANQQLPAEISNDVTIDLQDDFRDFILQRRGTQWEVLLPALFNARALLEKEEQVDRYEDQAERNPVTPRKPPMLVLTIVQTFSVHAGN